MFGENSMASHLLECASLVGVDASSSELRRSWDHDQDLTTCWVGSVHRGSKFSKLK